MDGKKGGEWSSIEGKWIWRVGIPFMTLLQLFLALALVECGCLLLKHVDDLTDNCSPILS
jgi:hypothetical protein